MKTDTNLHGIPEENIGLFWNTFKHLTNGGCPPEQAAQCSRIVALDKPGEPNLGRSEADMQLIKDSLKYLNRGGDA